MSSGEADDGIKSLFERIRRNPQEVGFPSIHAEKANLVLQADTFSSHMKPLKYYLEQEEAPPSAPTLRGQPLPLALPSSEPVRLTEDPFKVHIDYLTLTPWTPEPTTNSWQRVSSYAWLIFHRACKYPDTCKVACTWGHAFLRAFQRPYIKVVLPVFDPPQVTGQPSHQANLLDKLLSRLHQSYGIICNALDVTTILQQLVRC